MAGKQSDEPAISYEESDANKVDNATDASVRERKCSKCSQLCRGDVRPYGKDCQNEDQQLTHANEGILVQLVQQMSLMNANLTLISKGQDELKTFLVKQSQVTTHVESSNHDEQPVKPSGGDCAEDIADVAAATALPNGNRVYQKAIKSAKNVSL